MTEQPTVTDLGGTAHPTGQESTARLLRCALACDATTLVALDMTTAVAVVTVWAGATTVSTCRQVLSRATADALGTHLTRRTATATGWTAVLAVPRVHHLLVLPLHAAGGSRVAWLLGRDGRGFSPDDVEHAALLTPGLRQRLDRTDRAEPDPATCLTTRELEVLELIGLGLTSAAAARRFGISERTVQKHLEHVYEKLGCRDRLSAVLRVRAAGLLRAAATGGTAA